MSDLFVVRRAEFSIEKPWALPPQAGRVPLRRATDGHSPRLATSLGLYWDDEFLTALFSGCDDRVVATHLEHDAPLYEEDVVEAFLAPRRPSEYFEIEVNPRGTVFDARIESPDGVRSTMKAELGWDAPGLFTAICSLRRPNELTDFDIVLRLPFRDLRVPPPQNGEMWKANFFRVDRHAELGDEYSAWQPTMKNPADFHVTAAFGTLRFEG